MKRKGQGALEYLLLIGGAILVAVIVISILVGLGGSSGIEAEKATADAICAKYPTTVLAECTGAFSGVAPDQIDTGTSCWTCTAAAAGDPCRATTDDCAT